MATQQPSRATAKYWYCPDCNAKHRYFDWNKPPRYCHVCNHPGPAKSGAKPEMKGCSFNHVVEIGEQKATSRCPLLLPGRIAVGCPCRTATNDCTFPRTVGGEKTISNPAKFKVALLKESECSDGSGSVSSESTTQSKPKKPATKRKKKTSNRKSKRQEKNSMSSTATTAASPEPEGNGNKSQQQPTELSKQLARIPALDRITDPLEFIAKFGDAMYASKMFGCNNREQGRMLAMTCLCEGRAPTEIARTYHIIGGKMSMRSDAMLAEFRKRGGEHEIIEQSENRACVKLSMKIGRKKEEHEFALTWEQAKQEPFVYGKKGQLKDNWATPRARMQMLWARAISHGVRSMMPEVNAGYYTPEEVADFSPSNTPQLSPEAEERRQQIVGGNNGNTDEIIDAVVEPAAPNPATDVTTNNAAPETSVAPQPVATTSAASEVPAVDSASAANRVDTAQLLRLKEQLTALEFPKERWKGLLADSYNVTSAKELSHDDAEKLIADMDERLRSKQDTQRMNDWANDQVKKNLASGSAAMREPETVNAGN